MVVLIFVNISPLNEVIIVDYQITTKELILLEKIAIIGAGFSGLSAAYYMAKEGFRVSVYEKNSEPGGRARRYRRDGFTFDMGPTFY